MSRPVSTISHCCTIRKEDMKKQNYCLNKPYENAESSGRALLAAFEKRDKLGNARQLELKQFKKNRAAKQVKNSDIAKWQSDIFDFGQITRSPDFLIEITKRLKEVIIARYRN